MGPKLIHLWVDDQLDDPATPNRHTPKGWLGVKTAMQACRIIAKGNVVRVSLDHDLGEGNGDGYLVARFIETRAAQGKLPPLQVQIHSANPVGRQRMQTAIFNAESSWRTLECGHEHASGVGCKEYPNHYPKTPHHGSFETMKGFDHAAAWCCREGRLWHPVAGEPWEGKTIPWQAGEYKRRA